MYDKCLDPSARTALSALGPAWGKDYPDATTFAEPLFGSASLGPDACCNYSLVGADPKASKKYDYSVTEVPSVDDQIAGMRARSTDEERIQCWADFDEYADGRRSFRGCRTCSTTTSTSFRRTS